MTDAAFLAISEVCKLIRLIIEDQPPTERVKSWERWYKFWEPFWKAVGLGPAPDFKNP